MQAETILPRVLNKLTLSVYPMATIMPEVTRITGLDKYNLTGQARFDNHIGDLLNAFLARLPSPVCLVAHNFNKSVDFSFKDFYADVDSLVELSKFV